MLNVRSVFHARAARRRHAGAPYITTSVSSGDSIWDHEGDGLRFPKQRDLTLFPSGVPEPAWRTVHCSVTPRSRSPSCPDSPLGEARGDADTGAGVTRSLQVQQLLQLVNAATLLLCTPLMRAAVIERAAYFVRMCCISLKE